MFVKYICYPVHVLGPGQRVGIWTAGCDKRCRGCMSPEMQTTEGCRDYDVSELAAMLGKISGKIDGVTISGGEPFRQAKDLRKLVEHIRANVTDDIIVYTGYTFEELSRDPTGDAAGVLENISVLIDGEYVDELNDGRGIRGSSNQRVIVFRNGERYKGLDTIKRELQSFRFDNRFLVVGVQ